MRATAEPVDGNKVKLSVEVDEAEIEKVLDEAVRTLSRQVRVPGFRPGKVPRRVLEARMGGAVALRAEALREALPDFYAQAVSDAELDPIAQPEIDITAGEESGPLSFDAVVEVRPVITVPGYDGLVVTVPSPKVTEAEVDAQVDRLREQEGELVPIDRPAIDGDYVTIDIHATDPLGTEVLGRDDFVYEVGSGAVTPELDAELRGTRPGAILAFTATANDGTQVSFKVLVKEVQEKRLPEVTDDWAAENSDFDTVEELRADLTQRIGRVKAVQARLAMRENAINALVELVDDEVVPEVLVDQEVGERVHSLGHRLEQQRITLDQFLAVTGQDQESLLAELRTDARREVKADLALRAVAEAEGLEVDETEFEAELASTAERMGTDSAELRHRLDHAGRTGAVRSEQRKAKALTWLLDHVDLVDDEGAPVSREELEVDLADAGEDTAGEPGGAGGPDERVPDDRESDDPASEGEEE